MSGVYKLPVLQGITQTQGDLHMQNFIKYEIRMNSGDVFETDKYIPDSDINKRTFTTLMNFDSHIFTNGTYINCRLVESWKLIELQGEDKDERKERQEKEFKATADAGDELESMQGNKPPFTDSEYAGKSVAKNARPK